MTRHRTLNDSRPGEIRVTIIATTDLSRHGLGLIVSSTPGLEVLESLMDVPSTHGSRETDVVLLELRGPHRSNCPSYLRLKLAFPDAALVVLTPVGEPFDVEQAVVSGVRGCLTDDVTSVDLVHAIQTAARGETIISCTLARQTSENLQSDGATSRLTQRQTEVLSLLKQGMRNQQVADRMGISVNTVKNHVRAVYRTLDTHSRTEAIMRLTNDWVPGESPLSPGQS